MVVDQPPQCDDICHSSEKEIKLIVLIFCRFAEGEMGTGLRNTISIEERGLLYFNSAMVIKN